MSFRKLVFWIHLAIGCLAGAIILIMSVTGVLLMYQRQVTNWFARDPRAASPRARAARLPMETVLAGIYSQKGATPSGDQGSQPPPCLFGLASCSPSAVFFVPIESV